MTTSLERLQQWLAEIAISLKQNKELTPVSLSFLAEPEMAMYIVDAIIVTEEIPDPTYPPKGKLYLVSNAQTVNNDLEYTICLCALEICLTQLQNAKAQDNQIAAKLLDDLMKYIAYNMTISDHSLEFWLPIINAFYDIHIELNDAVKDAYMDLALDDDNDDDELVSGTDNSHILQELIADMSDLSAFDIAENFFAQSYAMPDEFYIDFVLDLLQFPTGIEIAILSLLHPTYV